jgi:cytochrome c oxidase assembly protein subunit 15
VRTPLGWAAARWELHDRALRWSTTAALIVSIIIVFTGGLVRVTGSGLGCPDWPTCEGGSIAPTAELGIHGVIEFANRLLTAVIVVAVGWVIIAARLQRPRNRAVTRLAWSQFWLVVANAVAGGITVWQKLNPWVVALHFVLAIGLLATTAVTWHRVHEDRSIAREPLGGRARVLAWWLTGVTGALILVGTTVSGSGPHSGDSSDVPRMALDWTTVAIIHGTLGVAILVLGLALWVTARGAGERTSLVRRRLVVLLVVIVLQGLSGLIQSFTGLPAGLVSFHLLGSALVWVGVLRVLLDVDPTLFARIASSPDRSRNVPVESSGSQEQAQAGASA